MQVTINLMDPNSRLQCGCRVPCGGSVPDSGSRSSAAWQATLQELDAGRG